MSTYTAKLFVAGKAETQSVQAANELDAFNKVLSAAASRFPNQSIMVLTVEREKVGIPDFFKDIFK